MRRVTRFKRSAGERGIGEIDRDRVIEHAANTRRRDRPAISAAIRVKPIRNLGVALAAATRRNAKPDPHGEASFGEGDYFARLAGIIRSVFMRRQTVILSSLYSVHRFRRYRNQSRYRPCSTLKPAGSLTG